MTVRQDRLLPNRYLRYFLEAVEAEMGAYSLGMLLRSADLERYISKLPKKNTKRVAKASEFAALQAALRTYYGQGARGSLNRIGRDVWYRSVGDTLRGKLFQILLPKFLKPLARGRLALNILAKQMKNPDGQVSVHLLDTEMIFMDTTSDSTVEQNAEDAVCWFTQGMVDAALFWATGMEEDVEEIACRAMGAEACKFRIRV